MQFGEIIELGAGCGLCGLTCLKNLQSNVCCAIYLTDYDPGSLKLLEENIALNRASDSSDTVTIQVKELKWGDIAAFSNILLDVAVLIIGNIMRDINFNVFLVLQ